MVKSYLDLTIKFHDYSSFFTAFDVASNTAAHLLCVQERAPLENINNGAIWHIWRTYAKFFLK